MNIDLGNVKPVDGVVIVVDEGQVEPRTWSGYRLLQIIFDEAADMLHETTCDNENGYNNSYGTRTHTVSKPVVVRKARFVMVLDADSALERKTAELERATSKTHEHEQFARDAHATIAAFEKQVAELEAAKRRTSEQYTEKHKETVTLREQVRKFEIDIGKIRKAIGERQMKEILES